MCFVLDSVNSEIKQKMCFILCNYMTITDTTCYILKGLVDFLCVFVICRVSSGACVCMRADPDFMQAAGAQAELFFWLTVEGYRVTAQQQLEAMHGWQKDSKSQPSATKGLLKAAALGVYEQYLSDKVGGAFSHIISVVSCTLSYM